MKKSEEKILLSIGFSKKDILVYKTLLSEGSKSINQIKDETRLPRSTVVVSLQKLINDEIITYHIRGKRKNYVVDTPQRLSAFINKKITELQRQKSDIQESLIPELEKIHFLTSDPSKIEVRLLQGEEGFQELYKLTLEQSKGSEILRFGGIPERFIISQDFLKQYTTDRDKKGIRTRLLLSETAMAQAVKSENILDVHEAKTLPKNIYSPEGNIAIWGDMVSFISWDKELSATLVKNKKLAEMLRMIFHICWNKAK